MRGYMKKKPESTHPQITLGELAHLLDCPFKGNESLLLSGVASLERAQNGDLVFLSHSKYRELLDKTSASAAIIPLDEKIEKIPVIRSKNPYLSFIKAVEFFYKPYRPEPGIHPQAYISSSASLGKDISIGAFTFIGENVEIGDGSIIFPLTAVFPGVKIGKHTTIHSHVSIREDVSIGDRVIIHSGTVLGSDGLGFAQAENGTHVKIPQKGSVIIEDDVEIGANSTIDRAALDNTIIKKGTKIDNLVQIAHSVEIGENNILAAQTGIAGSTKTGKNVLMGGQVGIIDHLTIGDSSIIAAQSGVGKDLAPGSVVGGSPHLDIKTWRKACAAFPRIYDLLKEIKLLTKRVEDLEKKK
jgi:UDP-3-O-[3-hydroxymyristoyl] glucosamine N-acyltransferase